MTKRPLIGLSLDLEEQGSFSTDPYYCLRQNYFDAIYEAGGIPIAIPFIYDAIPQYFSMIRGLVIPGGDFAFPDEWYLSNHQKSPYPISKRLNFDIEIITKALSEKLPLLTICAGMQIMGCINGCQMNGKIESQINHRVKNRHDPVHDISIKSNTLLHSILGKNNISVNSVHCEEIIRTSNKVIVSATANDDVIEAIEVKNHPFALGLQWHPEFFIKDNNHMAIFKALIDKAKD